MNVKIIVISIIAFLLVLPVSSLSAIEFNQKTEYKKLKYFIESKNILYVGGIGPGNYSNIQYAIDNATEGCTIFIYDDSSPYKENLIINKTIKLIGENKESTVINGDSEKNVILILAEYVYISGLSIQMNGIGEGNSGILVRKNNSMIYENIILNNDWGIEIYDSSSNSIIKNKFLNNKCGLYLKNSGNIVKDNQFFNDGIYLSTSGNIFENNTANYKPIVYLEDENNKLIDYECGQIILVNCNTITISNQRITKTDTGIILSNCNNCKVIGNDILDCKSGIHLTKSNYNNLSYNDIYQNKNCGIILYESDYNTLEHNYCTEHLLGEFRYHGMYMSRSDNNSIKNNVFKKNHVGIGCSASYDNIFFENSISDNTYIGMMLETLCERNNIETNIIRGNGRGLILMNVGFNNILYNDFYKNEDDITIEVIQYYKIRLQHFPKLSGNYWDKARIIPKFILGKFTYIYDDEIPWGGGYTIKWLYVDWYPAIDPNN